MGPPINKREEVWKPFQEQFERDLPWLKDFLGPGRAEFYQGLVKVIVEYRNFPPRIFYRLLKANKDFMEETSKAISKRIGKSRIAPPIVKGKSIEESVYEVNRIIASTVIVGNLFRIDPRFLITVAAYETQFQNKKGKDGTGVCQITQNSSFSELRNQEWIDRVNMILANLGGAEVMFHKLEREDLMNPFLNVLEAGKTMILKMAVRKVDWEKIEDGNPEYKKLAFHYNGNPEVQKEYGNNVYDYYKEFYGVAVKPRYKENELKKLSEVIPKKSGKPQN